MKALVQRLESRVTKLEGGSSAPAAQAPAPKKPAAPAEDDEDDDIDLFGSDEEVQVKQCHKSDASVVFIDYTSTLKVWIVLQNVLYKISERE